MILLWNKSYIIRAGLAAYVTATEEVLLSGTSSERRIDLSLVLGSNVAPQRQPDGRLDQRGKAAPTGTTPSLSRTGDDDGDSALHFQQLPGDVNYSGDFFVVVGQPTTVGLFAQMNDQMRLDFEDGDELSRLLKSATPCQVYCKRVEECQTAGDGSSGGVPVGVASLRSANHPHGAIFWTGGNSALNAQPYVLAGQPSPDPSYHSNGYGLSFGSQPFIPGLIKPSSKDFILLNFSGQLATTLVNEYGIVPTDLERRGNFSQLADQPAC